MAFPRYTLARRHIFQTRAAASVTLTTNWVNIDTALDCIIPAAVFDVLKVQPAGLYGTQADTGFLHACTIISGSPVNFIDSQGEPTTSTGEGCPAWQATPSISVGIGVPARYVVQVGDIATSTGLVTIRLRGRSASGTRTLLATTADQLQFGVENLGPQYGS